MGVDERRVWRAAPATLALVVLFVVVAAVAVPVLAYLVWTDRGDWAVPSLLAGLTVISLLYAWRFGLHPRLQADRSGVTVINPFSSARFDWDDIRVVAPGTDGLVIASTDRRAEAWCVQKSSSATRRDRSTRADRIAADLFTLLEEHDPPQENQNRGLRIRRVRPDESRTLAGLERAASEDALAHVFPPQTYPFPLAEITRRWRRSLRDPQVRAFVLEHDDDPVGYVAFDADTVRHLGVLPDQVRRGYGTALLEYATREIFDAGAPAASLWVLEANSAARAFYAAQQWHETADRRDCAFEPKPVEQRLERRNPAAPRRSR